MKKYFSLLSRERNSNDKREKHSLSSEFHENGFSWSDLARNPSSGVSGGNLGGNLEGNRVFTRSGEKSKNLGDGSDFRFRRSEHFDAYGVGISQEEVHLKPPDPGKPPDLSGSGAGTSRSDVETYGSHPLHFRSDVEGRKLVPSGVVSGKFGANHAKGKNLRVGGSSDVVDGDFQQMGSQLEKMPCFSHSSVQEFFSKLNKERIYKENVSVSDGNGKEADYNVEFPSLPKKIQFKLPGKNSVPSIPISFPDLNGNETYHVENAWNKRLSFAQATKENFKPPVFPRITFRAPDVKNGKPIVRFTEEEISRAAAPLKWCLVGKFTNGRPSLMEILQGMKRAVDFTEEIFPAAIDQRHVLIRFQNRDDFVKAYVKELWWFGKRRMRVFRWTPGFAPGLESSIVPVWVGLRGVRPHMLDSGMLQSLVAPIGTFLCCHKNVTNFSRLGYTQVCVEVDRRVPLITSILVDNGGGRFGPDFEVFVEYLNLPPFCSLCGMVGHEVEKCRRTQNSAVVTDDSGEHGLLKLGSKWVKKEVQGKAGVISNDNVQKMNTWVEKNGSGEVQISADNNGATSSRNNHEERIITESHWNGNSRIKVVKESAAGELHNSDPKVFQDASNSKEQHLLMLRKLQKWKKVYSPESSLIFNSNGSLAGVGEQQCKPNKEDAEALIAKEWSLLLAKWRDEKLAKVEPTVIVSEQQDQTILKDGNGVGKFEKGESSKKIPVQDIEFDDDMLLTAQISANRDDSNHEHEILEYVSDSELSPHRFSHMHMIPRRSKGGLKDLSYLF